jgi:spermidine/putrescine transport system permease protein
MWMNFLLRTYGWISILEKNGAINNFLRFIGLGAWAEKTILYTDSAVLLGMVYNFLPFMILPIYTVLTKMDYSLIEAAQDLGANQANVFRRVIFPLSAPGVASGVTMVFMPAVTTFIVSNLLGGAQYMLIGNLIERQILVANNWNLASALSIILMAIILLTMTVLQFVDKDGDQTGGALL